MRLLLPHVALLPLFSTILITATRAAPPQVYDLTLTFSSASSLGDDCAAPGPPEAITFSTSFSSAPGIGACITLSDVFASNTSTRYRNTSFSIDTGSSLERVNITYALANQASYDPQANYSRVLYSQIYPGAVEGGATDEHYAAPRNVNFYAGQDCTEGASDSNNGDGEGVMPWYRSNCRADSDCQVFPFSVRSFYVYVPDGDEEEQRKRLERKGKCVLGAEYGAASAVRPGLAGVLAGIVSVLIWQMVP